MAPTPYAAELRQRVEALVRGSDDTLARIAAQAGVPAFTVARWNRAHGWRPSRVLRTPWRVPLTPRRREAVERLYRNPAVATADLAAALGVPRRRAAAYFRSCGFEGRRKAVVCEPPPDPVGGRSLRRSLRGHVARQIARFDAALGDEAARIDSAKVLRDLGGLKRLLDTIDADERAGEGGDGGGGAGKDGAGTNGSATSPIPLDLPALRARIAQRYAAFAGERADAGLPGEPAA